VDLRHGTSTFEVWGWTVVRVLASVPFSHCQKYIYHVSQLPHNPSHYYTYDVWRIWNLVDCGKWPLSDHEIQGHEETVQQSCDQLDDQDVYWNYSRLLQDDAQWLHRDPTIGYIRIYDHFNTLISDGRRELDNLNSAVGPFGKWTIHIVPMQCYHASQVIKYVHGFLRCSFTTMRSVNSCLFAASMISLILNCRLGYTCEFGNTLLISSTNLRSLWYLWA